jgi:hypothetical protein
VQATPLGRVLFDKVPSRAEAAWQDAELPVSVRNALMRLKPAWDHEKDVGEGLRQSFTAHGLHNAHLSFVFCRGPLSSYYSSAGGIDQLGCRVRVRQHEHVPHDQSALQIPADKSQADPYAMVNRRIFAAGRGTWFANHTLRARARGARRRCGGRRLRCVAPGDEGVTI